MACLAAIGGNGLGSKNIADGRLHYLPVAFFGLLMGLSGLAVAWRLARVEFGAPLWIAEAIGAVALLAFIAQTIAYLIKIWFSFASVYAEFRNPVICNLFGTPLISVLQLPLLISDNSLPLARAIWCVGAVAMAAFSWFIVVHWIDARKRPVHVTPAWMVPMVGVMHVPLAVPQLGWAVPLHGVMVFTVSVGLFFSIVLFAMIFSRLMFEEPLPDVMQPSLLILAAPFAVGFSAYVLTVGKVDMFAEALFMLMVFVLIVLVTRIRHLGRCCPFRVSWWAVSFPLTASANAALRYAGQAGTVAALTIAVVLLAVATVSIFCLAGRTLAGIARGDLQALDAS
jgi:tellurite resistance protein